MSKKFSKVLLVVIALTLLISGASFADSVNVYYFDKKVEMPVEPVLQNGRTLVPMRAIFETMGADVEWDNVTKTVIARKDSLEIKLPIGNRFAEFTEYDWDIQGDITELVELEVPATIINGSTFVPLRFISETLGATVEWDGNTRSVYIK